MGDCVDRDLVERLIEAALDRTSYDWTFDYELEKLKFMDLVAEVRGGTVYKPGDVHLTLADFPIGSVIRLTNNLNCLYMHADARDGDTFKVTEHVYDGGRYDRILVELIDSVFDISYEFLLIDQDCYELIG